MPETSVVFFKEDDENIPILDWLDSLPNKVKVKCRWRIERLRDLGHELRRPEADYLRDGIYELRVRHQRVNYRMLYFFHGRTAVVISHGLVKERVVPSTEINRAMERKGKFEPDPEKHRYSED